MVKACAKGEFYDVVVEACMLCSDVCNPQRVSPLPFNCRQGCAGYYREKTTALTFSNTEDEPQDFGNRYLAISVAFTCVAALSVVILAFLACRIGCRKSKIDQQRVDGEVTSRRRRRQRSAAETALMSTDNDDQRAPNNDNNDTSTSLCFKHDSV